MLFDNIEDPYQMVNLINDPAHAATQAGLERMLADHMARIGDELLPRETFYTRFGIELDDRGKVVDLVENMYDRVG